MENEFKNLIQKLEFSPISVIHVNSKKTDYVVIGICNGEKVLLKTSAADDVPKNRGYDKEYLAERIMRQLEKKKLINHVPRTQVYKTGKDFSLIWILRQYIEGESLCDYSNLQNTTLFGYDIIRPHLQACENTIIPKIYDIMQIFNQINPSIKNMPEESEKLSPRFSKKLIKDNADLILKITDGKAGEALEYYNKNTSFISQTQFKSACFGDMVPANFILAEDKIIISDFEWFCFDNYMMDVAQLWLFLLNYPRWQDKLTSLTIKCRDDEENFRLAIIRIVVNCKWHHRFIQNDELFRWYQYLINAGESIDDLIGKNKNFANFVPGNIPEVI